MEKFFAVLITVLLFALLLGCSSKGAGDFNKDALANREGGLNIDRSNTGFEVSGDNSDASVSGSRSCGEQSCFANAVKACTESNIDLTINTQVLSGSFDASVIGKQLKTNLCKVETGFVGTIRGEQYTCEFVVYYDEELKPKMVTPSTENSEVCASIQAIMTTLGIEA